jgi:glycosyltransferase involved in cell wall biosynthesis
MNISATIITLNEENNIGDCLASLDWAAEIVVVDSGSTDRTEEICRANPKVRFSHHPWTGFGRQKNVAAALALNDWIFNIDADERVTSELAVSILAADFAGFQGFRMARENYFGRKWIRHCGWYPDLNLRLYNRRECRFSERSVHETVECRGKVAVLKGNLRHFTYSGISDYLLRMDRYSTLAAAEVVKSGKKPGVMQLLVKPVFTFVKMYLLKRGFMDGYHGLLLSLLYAEYTFAKYAKALELENRTSAKIDTQREDNNAS